MEQETRAPVRELERAEVPWVVAYLREDLQDLRNDVRRLDTKIDNLRQDVDARIDGLRQDMDARIDGLRQDMEARFGIMNDRIDGLSNDIEELRREMGSYVRWMITTMVAVGALIVAAIKLLP